MIVVKPGGRFYVFLEKTKTQKRPLVLEASPSFWGLAEDFDIAFVVDNSIINSDNISAQAFIGNNDFVKKLRQYYGIKETNPKGGCPRKASYIKT